MTCTNASVDANVGLLKDTMMDKKRWLWKRKSSDKSPGETESSGSVSSYSERHSDEQQEVSKESSNESNHSPDVTSKAVACAEDVGDSSVVDAELPEELESKPLTTTSNIDNGSLEKDESGVNENINSVNEGDLIDGPRNISEKLSAELVNANAKAKEDLVKQHAKVAEEAIAGWEKAENEVAVLKKQLDTVSSRNSALEDRVAHLDGALKECVRQLRQTREEQEENINDAVSKTTQEMESAKIKLENKLIELQNKLDASNARSYVDPDMCQKIEWLEKENMALRHEILVQSEELKIKTIERDLSTQAAETASKQHLESIKKVAKIEAECRVLKSLASRASLVNDHKSIASSSFCVESLTDSQSDSGERLTAVESDIHKMSGSELNRCEPCCSDSWASALIAELDQFKNEKCRQAPSSSVKIDLMDDFLEMERLVAFPETKNESFVQESVIANQCVGRESSLRVEFETMNQQMGELKGKLEMLEADKAELEIALMRSEECIEESRLMLIEAEEKLKEYQRELENAYKSKLALENHVVFMEEEAQLLSGKVDSLEAEVDKERAVSHEIAMKCKDLEEEVKSKSAMLNLLETEVGKERTVSHEFAMKCKELEEEVERKSAMLNFLEAAVEKERTVSHEIAMKCKELEEELECKSAKVDLLEEVAKERTVSDKIAVKCKELEEEVEVRSAKVSLLEAEVNMERAVSDKIAMKCKELEEELEIKSAKVDLLEAEVDKERIMSQEIAMKYKELEEEIFRSTASSYGEKKIKQEDLALAAGKLAECQKTIASLGNQLKSLATLEDFLIDTASIPASPSLIAHASGETWKLHSNHTFSPKRDSTASRLADGSSSPSLNKNEESSPPPSTAAMSNHVSSEKNRNGFAKFFSRTKSGIRLEI